ncbi:MAG: metal-sensitive transcriptional regulator [Candidatus Margulisiibacteriota bacterium]
MLKSGKKEQVAKRLNRISGQVDGIKKMVDDSRYCVDVLNQIAAVRAALSGVGQFILEDHLKTCVSTAIKKGKGQAHIKELMDVFKKF